MTYQTHKRFAIFWVYLGAMIIYKYNISNINYYLMLIVMLATGKAGALFPDVDHDWKNVKEKTTINLIINKIIHATGGKHRSWQTHSWDICIIFTLACYISSIYLFRLDKISAIDFELFNVITAGFNLGWISHLFADMLTSSGVRVLCIYNKKISFVPRCLSRIKVLIVSVMFIGGGIATVILKQKIDFLSVQFGIILLVVGVELLGAALKLGNITFNTGNEWEAYVYSISKRLNILFGLVAIAYPIIDKISI